ncbi:hypothetical protein [Streptomyces sp. I6]|uniref:hypothetical protein n=1 Tax=Streptomyces sp. I6 TaxID=2483113 RepID=UPI002880ADF6|nr:hypothetical protein [Streptomyces sp. I6]
MEDPAGLESLSSHVLALMRKGSSRLLNIRLLKWAHYYGVRVDWNLLAGFPGETDEDYTDQAALVPLLTHLEPPAGVGRIWLERFSPYFTDPSFGMSEVTPKTAYRLAFPVPGMDHSRIAYFFDYRAPDVASPDAVAELAKAVEAWGRAWASADRPALAYRRGPDWLTLYDTRGGLRRKTTLAGWRARAYELCGDTPRSAARVHRELAGRGGGEGFGPVERAEGFGQVERAEVEEFLGSCVAHGICLEEGGRYFSLALPLRSGLPGLAGEPAGQAGDRGRRPVPGAAQPRKPTAAVGARSGWVAKWRRAARLTRSSPAPRSNQAQSPLALHSRKTGLPSGVRRKSKPEKVWPVRSRRAVTGAAREAGTSAAATETAPGSAQTSLGSPLRTS